MALLDCCSVQTAALLCLALAVLRFPDQVYAQFTAPGTYDNTPVGVNQFELDYVYTRANAPIDTSLIVAGAKLNLNQGTINYTRDFSFFHRLAWAEAMFRSRAPTAQ